MCYQVETLTQQLKVTPQAIPVYWLRVIFFVRNNEFTILELCIINVIDKDTPINAFQNIKDECGTGLTKYHKIVNVVISQWS